jgi:THO complex subunit 3
MTQLQKAQGHIRESFFFNLSGSLLTVVLNSLRTLAWNPTGQLIATGSADRTLRIWNPERPAIKYSTELRGHSAAVEKVLFNPVRDAELASCSTDGTVRFWDVRSKTCVSRLDVGGEAFTLSWSADGSTMVVGRKVSREDFLECLCQCLG